jgi:diadenosine tetraphosphatase ApaH/serine/threonine PP2A family protein phosphatase
MMRRPLCFVGHSHVPGIFVEEATKVTYLEQQDVVVSAGKKYIVNVGSVGQPRDTDPRAAYCIYDTQKATIQIKRITYDISAAQEKITKAGLPIYLASRLSKGV